jgi:hypothetical protein
MTTQQRRKVDRVEFIALMIFAALLFLLALRNTEPSGLKCPRIYQVSIDSKGNCRLYGLPVSSLVVRRAVFQAISIFGGGEVDMNLFSGWARNPNVKSKVMAVGDDIERFGLDRDSADRVLAEQRKKLDQHR